MKIQYTLKKTNASFILAAALLAFQVNSQAAILGATAGTAQNQKARTCNQSALASEQAALNHVAPGEDESPEFMAMQPVDFSLIENCLDGLINFSFDISGLLSKIPGLGALGKCANGVISSATGIDYNQLSNSVNSQISTINNSPLSTGGTVTSTTIVNGVQNISNGQAVSGAASTITGGFAGNNSNGGLQSGFFK